MRRPPPHLLLVALIAAAAFAAFWPALDNGFVNWDDNVLLTNNARYRGFSPGHLRWMFTTFLMGHWEPLTWVSWAADHARVGMDPRGYHLTNLALHAATAIGVYFLILALLRVRGGLAAVEAESPHARPAAFLATLLFAVHPLRVESVAWATERRDVLSGLFLVLTVLAWLHAKRREADGAPAWGRWAWAALAAYVLSLLSKAWGITLPAVLLILDVWPLQRLRTRGALRLLLEKLPFAIPAGGAAVLAFLAQRSSGAMNVAADNGLVQRAAQAAWGLCFYPLKTLAPWNLSPLYLIDLDLDPTRPVYLAAFATVGVVTVALLALRRRWPAGIASWIAFAAIVSPVLGLTQSGIQMAADRYSYLACLPFAALVAAGLARLGPRAFGPALLVVLALGWGARQQTLVWRDSGTLWQRAIAHDADNWFALCNRGAWNEELEDFDAALADYDRTLELNSNYHIAWNNRGQVRFLLARRAFDRDDRDTAGELLAGARDDFTSAITIHNGYGQAWNGRGLLRAQTGDAAGARSDFDEAVARKPLLSEAWNNRGNLRIEQGDLAGGIADLRMSIEINPISPDTMLNLGTALLRQGAVEGAARELERALGLAPDDWAHRDAARAKLEAALSGV